MLRALLCILALAPVFSHASPPLDAGCGGDISCGSEQVIGRDDRIPPTVQQEAVDAPIMGSCGKPLPANKAYGAVLGGISCSPLSGGVKHYNRLPLELPKEMRYAWLDARDSGSSDSRFKMQQARKQEYKWSDKDQTNVTQSWTWQKKVGGYRAQFGSEDYVAKCSVSRQRRWTTREWKWVRGSCIEWEQEVEESRPNSGYVPSPSPDYNNNYNRRSQDYNPPPTNNYNNGYSRKSQDYSPPPRPAPSKPRGGDTGYGESKRSSSGRWKGSMNEYLPQSEFVLVSDRSPARSCLRYDQVKQYYDQPHSEYLPDFTYDCTKSRYKWGTWYETQAETDSCGSQNVNLNYQFVTSSNWKPGYVDPSAPNKLRDYHDSLPNQWDLLPGETETVSFEPTTSSGGLSGSVDICSSFKDPETHSGCLQHGWNDYRAEVTPARCEFGKDLNMKIDIHTLGRVKRIAPNPLKVVGLEFDPVIKAHPDKLIVIDTSRQAMLDAAENSRTFRTGPKSEVAGASASGGYWEETRFKMSLFRKVQDGKLERTTFPNMFGSNQGDIIGSKMSISLVGQTGLDRLYRPGGPFERIFGFLYKNSVVKLSPNTEYILKVQIVQRGVPWYESGCRGGADVCAGEVGSTDDYTEPVEVQFRTPDVDERTIWEKIMDWQKARRSWGKGA